VGLDTLNSQINQCRNHTGEAKDSNGAKKVVEFYTTASIPTTHKNIRAEVKAKRRKSDKPRIKKPKVVADRQECSTHDIEPCLGEPSFREAASVLDGGAARILDEAEREASETLAAMWQGRQDSPPHPASPQELERAG
jgi:hypothetical protein